MIENLLFYIFRILVKGNRCENRFGHLARVRASFQLGVPMIAPIFAPRVTYDIVRGLGVVPEVVPDQEDGVVLLSSWTLTSFDDSFATVVLPGFASFNDNEQWSPFQQGTHELHLQRAAKVQPFEPAHLKFRNPRFLARI